VLLKRANLLLDGNFFSKPGILKETFSKRAIHPIFIIVPGCALKLGNQRKQNTAIGRLDAGRSQVRENYLVLMNLSRLGVTWVGGRNRIALQPLRRSNGETRQKTTVFSHPLNRRKWRPDLNAVTAAAETGWDEPGFYPPFRRSV
jgi:hypothetical protein